MNMPERTAREQFDRQAAHYDSQWNTWSEETLKWMLDNAHPRPEDTVLDVATGTGFTALAFAPYVRTVTGLDVSPGMLAQAERQAQEAGLTNVTFCEGTAEALPFAEGSFDLVTCRIAPHHFLSIPRFVAEVRRVLKPGGHFILVDTSVPDDEPEVDTWQNEVEALRDPSHVRNYSPGQWRAFMEEAGLAVEMLTDTGSGITINLNDWLIKAGCTPEQSEAVRKRFAEAPLSALEAFHITPGSDGDVHFTWQRVACKALKV